RKVRAMWVRFSARSREAVFRAIEEAQRFGDDRVSPEHLLLVMLMQDTIATNLLDRLGIPREVLRTEIELQLPRHETPSSWDPQLTEAGKRAVVLAAEQATLVGSSYVGTEHLLLGILAEGECL